jgi:hypothetical protein
LRSWSGPVETDFQGRPRFSYDNRPVHDGTKGFVTEINLVCLRFMSSLTRHIPARSVAAVARMRRHPTITRRGGRCMCSVRARYSQASRERRQNARMRPQGWRRQSAARASPPSATLVPRTRSPPRLLNKVVSACVEYLILNLRATGDRICQTLLICARIECVRSALSNVTNHSQQNVVTHYVTSASLNWQETRRMSAESHVVPCAVHIYNLRGWRKLNWREAL